MKTVLIIDDDAIILDVFSFALKDAGYHVLTAEDGASGLDLARRHLPDLILCDVNMPGLDGRDVLHTLRREAATEATQFVLMTGNTRGLPVRAGMELGADDFLTKPVELDTLLRCIEARLNRARVSQRVEDGVIANLRASLNSNLPHEFFTPLAGILGLVEILREDLPDMPVDEARGLLAEIETSGWRLHRTLKNYLLVLDLETQGNSRPPMPGLSSAEEAAQAVRRGIDQAAKRRNRTADMVVRIVPAIVCVSPADLVEITDELVDNACNFSRQGSPIQISFDPSGCLAVSDHGRGLTDPQIEQIAAFRQFDRKRFEQQGLGLGLTIVQHLAARHGVKLRLSSTPGAGTVAVVPFLIPSATGAAAG